MNKEVLKKQLKKYVEKYDLNNKWIKLKLYHSYRVMKISRMIAKKNNLIKEEIDIVSIIGLLHDYGRFEQLKKYNTLSDINSIDHGNLGVKRLFDENQIKQFTIETNYLNKYNNVMYDAIKNHNKYKIEENINQNSEIFCKIIRDADKLDIFYIMTYDKDVVKEDDELISNEIIQLFNKKESIDISKVNNKNEHILLLLANVYDLNYKYSYLYIKENNLINKIYEQIDNKKLFKKYFDQVNNYIEERIK